MNSLMAQAQTEKQQAYNLQGAGSKNAEVQAPIHLQLTTYFLCDPLSVDY